MAYEKHVWECGEPITESKLNHIEEGIASAGTFAVVTLSATGFSSATRRFGAVAYAMYKNNRWELINDDTSDGEIIGFDVPMASALPPLPILADETMCPFLVESDINIDVEATGGVSNVAENVYFSFGSYIKGYKITGNGHVDFIAV